MKMKKTLLTTAIAAALGAPMAAQAVHVSTDGTGQALLFPYYSAANNNNTFITLTNTTDQAKAVKVRFREGVGSRDTFDFTLYLSPFDHWVGIVSMGDSGVPVLTTTDESCTVPSLDGVNGPFSVLRISSTYAGPANHAVTRQQRISEGHLEVIEMADLDKTANFDDIEEAITHVNGSPSDCALPIDFTSTVATGGTFRNGDDIAIEDGTSLTDGTNVQRFLTPTGGLYGHAVIYNPDDGTYFSYNATALRALYQHPEWFPQNGNSNAALNPYSADSGLIADGGNVEYWDLPDLSTPDVGENLTSALSAVVNTTTFLGQQYQDDRGTPAGFATTTKQTFKAINTGATWNATELGTLADRKRDSVTWSLMRGGLQNDYITSGDFDTEWVVSFPTRYLHVQASTNANLNDEADAPFTKDEEVITGEACMDVDWQYADREEGMPTVSGSVGFSPGGISADAFQLCYEVNVMAFNQSDSAATGALKSWGSAKYVTLDSAYEDGWAALDFATSTDYRLAGMDGLPLIGFAAISDSSGSVPRGATFGHQLTNIDVAPILD
jgi:hypothetical protein